MAILLREQGNGLVRLGEKFDRHPAKYTVARQDRLDEVIEQPRLPVFFTSPTWQMNGVNVFTLNLAQGLARRSFETTILLTDPKKDETIPMSRPRDITFVELCVNRDDSMVHRWQALCGFLEQHRPCVYIPNYDWHTSCVTPRLSESIAIIGIIHSDDPRHYEHAARLGDTWNAAVAVSHRIAQQIAHEVPSISPRLRVIPIGVPIPRSQPRERGGDTPLRILYAGLLKQHQKRIFDVQEIARELLRRSVPFKLTFAGGGIDEERLRTECDDLVQQGHVRFLGILDRDQMTEEFNRNDVFIMTSEFEGMPNALLEAMAHYLVPMVSSIESGIPEVIRDGSNGLIAPVGNISGFAEGLTTLQKDRVLLKALATRARQTVVDGPFNLNRMTESFVEIIEQVSQEAVDRSFKRPRGAIRPPADLGPLWKHKIPHPLRVLWRLVRRRFNDQQDA